jgi:hypothetical protein
MRFEYVPVADRGILHDADTPEDYRALLAYHNRQILRPVVDIRLAAEKPFFDSRMPCCCSSSTTPAPCAWPAADADIIQLRLELINSSEEELGLRLVSRCQGGTGGSRTTLTAGGRGSPDPVQKVFCSA